MEEEEEVGSQTQVLFWKQHFCSRTHTHTHQIGHAHQCSPVLIFWSPSLTLLGSTSQTGFDTSCLLVWFRWFWEVRH